MASNQLTQFHEYAEGILTQLSPSARKQLARDIAFKLRTANRKRITAQIQPDGSKFQPPKKAGRIKRKMFIKLRTSRYLKVKSTPNQASVFINSTNRLVKVHHYGLRDRVNRKASFQVVYPKRELLGITGNDWQVVEELVLKHLTKE